MSKKNNVIGRYEWVSFPELGVEPFEAKIDSGADSSSIHGVDIEVFEKNGEQWLRVKVEKKAKNPNSLIVAEAKISDVAEVRSSNGQVQNRYFIQTPIVIGDDVFETRLSFTDRKSMKYNMLLGCSAMSGRYLIDVEQMHLQGMPQKG